MHPGSQLPLSRRPSPAGCRCYPCYCSGINTAYKADNLTLTDRLNAKAQCAPFVDSYDVKTLAIKWVPPASHLHPPTPGRSRVGPSTRAEP
jgi:hypothetical protein